MRRGFLYERAAELGCNKIALGHHFDDVIETLLMGIIYAAQIGGMLPRLKSTSHPGMELIRPLYYVHEKDIITWSQRHRLEFLDCACSFSARAKDDDSLSKRREMKNLIETLRQGYPNVDINIFRSMYNVHADTLISHDFMGVEHYFTERYGEKKQEE